MSTWRRRLPGELAFALILLLSTLFLMWHAYGIAGFSSITSAGVFPMLATGVMAVTMLVVIAQTTKTPRESAESGESLAVQFIRLLAPRELVLLSIAVLAYMLLLELLGFVICSYLFLVVSMTLLGSHRILLNLGVSALALAAIYLVFRSIFEVVLPTGTLLEGALK